MELERCLHSEQHSGVGEDSSCLLSFIGELLRLGRGTLLCLVGLTLLTFFAGRFISLTLPLFPLAQPSSSVVSLKNGIKAMTVEKQEPDTHCAILGNHQQSFILTFTHLTPIGSALLA